MNHGSLFSGIGGFDLAAEWMGWQNIFHCELNPFGRKVLHHYWPEAIQYHDITKTDFTVHRGHIDILTGGFPCQPYSAAGKRLGKEDDRHLWPEMLRAIREIQPRWIVGENVLGLVNWNRGLVFHEVQTDLETEGYQVQPYVLPAVSVNAPHRRDRVWFVAYRSSEGSRGELQQRQGQGKSRGCDSERTATNSSDIRRNNGGDNRKERYIQDNTNRNATENKSKRNGRQCRISKAGKNGNATNTNNKRLERTTRERIQENERRKRQSRKQQFTTWSSKDFWQKFPTQSPICGRNDGVSSQLDGITFSKWRNESIKAYGNAIVPQVVYQIFKSIQAYEN